MSLDAVGAPLLEPAFHLGTTPTTWAELLGVATGVVTVWLVVRQHILNWLFGLANVVLLGLVFSESGLYADALLQIVYVALQLFGWWTWRYAGPDRDQLAVARTSRAEWAVLVACGATATALWTVTLDSYSDSTVPFWDALTTALSLTATYGQCRKRLESWWLWIAADVVYIPLYAYKGLYLTAVLYMLFLVLCMMGLAAWRADLRARVGGPAQATA